MSIKKSTVHYCIRLSMCIYIKNILVLHLHRLGNNFRMSICRSHYAACVHALRLSLTSGEWGWVHCRLISQLRAHFIKLEWVTKKKKVLHGPVQFLLMSTHLNYYTVFQDAFANLQRVHVEINQISLCFPFGHHFAICRKSLYFRNGVTWFYEVFSDLR